MILTVVLSNHCDMDCAYCCIGDKNTSPILEHEDAIRFVLNNLKEDEENIVEFYGGEPTLYPRSVAYIITCIRVRSNSIYDIKFRLYTNGLFSLEYFNSISNTRNFIDAFDEILVSLDGFTYKENSLRVRGNRAQYNRIIDELKYLSEMMRRDKKLIISSVLSSRESYKNIYSNYEEFARMRIKHFSYEPLTIYNDDVPVIMKYREFQHLIHGLLEVIYDLSFVNGSTVFVAKELLSTKWYDVPCGSRCSDVARAISPRGNIYMCRDYAANEEKMFYSPKVVQFKKGTVNMLEKGYDDFDTIRKTENTLTPCIVKDIQYLKNGVQDKLYWLFPEFQDLIIRPMYALIMDLNTGNRDNIEKIVLEYNKILPDIFKELEKLVPEGLLE